jgi:hypothetical protein
MKDTIDYFTEIKETREYSMPDFQKIAEQILFAYKSFLWNNGVFTDKEFKFEDLTDEQKTTFALFTLKKYQPQNKYRQRILDYYFSNLNKPISELELEEALKEYTKHYYSQTPPTYLKLEKIEVREPHVDNLSGITSRIQKISNYIKIGKSIQFNIIGFPQNELYYLIIGMCIVDCLNTEHKTFKELLKHIKSYIQLFLTSKCLELRDSPDYNLITFINFGKERKPNVRYTSARKYFTDNSSHSKTQFISDDKGEYISTSYSSKEEYLSKFDELEKIFKSNKNKISNELIVKWFDGQLLTRSTCLVGCILIILMEKKTIEFKKDEMPDWKSIAQGNFDDTYIVKDEIAEGAKETTPTLGQVLLITRQYIQIIKKLIENTK